MVGDFLRRVRSERRKNERFESDKKLGLDGKARKELIDKTLFDNFRFWERGGTWMPAKWAGSGKRVILPIRVKFLEENKVNIESVGAFCPVKILPEKKMERRWRYA